MVSTAYFEFKFKKNVSRQCIEQLPTYEMVENTHVYWDEDNKIFVWLSKKLTCKSEISCKGLRFILVLWFSMVMQMYFRVYCVESKTSKLNPMIICMISVSLEISD